MKLRFARERLRVLTHADLSRVVGGNFRPVVFSSGIQPQLKEWEKRIAELAVFVRRGTAKQKAPKVDIHALIEPEEP